MDRGSVASLGSVGQLRETDSRGNVRLEPPRRREIDSVACSARVEIRRSRLYHTGRSCDGWFCVDSRKANMLQSIVGSRRHLGVLSMVVALTTVIAVLGEDKSPQHRRQRRTARPGARQTGADRRQDGSRRRRLRLVRRPRLGSRRQLSAVLRHTQQRNHALGREVGQQAVSEAGRLYRQGPARRRVGFQRTCRSTERAG